MRPKVIMPWNRPQVTRCGRIKIGMLGPPTKSKGGKTYQPPVKLDRIRVTHDHRAPDGNFAVNIEVMQALGAPSHNDRLMELPIEVHSDNIPDILSCRLARYTGRSSLACSGDGETARERVGQSDQWRERTCPCEKSTLVSKDGDCKPNGIFGCSIRVPGHRTIGAIHEHRTTSEIAISRLVGGLTEINNTVGTLRGLPLTLVLRKVELTGKAPVWCLNVELREISFDQAMAMADSQIATRRRIIDGNAGLPAGYRALPPGDDEAQEEQEAVALEFYPEVEHPVEDPSAKEVVQRDLE